MSSTITRGVAVNLFRSVRDFRTLAQTFVAGQTDKPTRYLGLSRVFGGSSVALVLRFAQKIISGVHKRSLWGCVDPSVRATRWA
jgi:hypothetical protein